MIKVYVYIIYNAVKIIIIDFVFYRESKQSMEAILQRFLLIILKLSKLILKNCLPLLKYLCTFKKKKSYTLNYIFF